MKIFLHLAVAILMSLCSYEQRLFFKCKDCFNRSHEALLRSFGRCAVIQKSYMNFLFSMQVLLFFSFVLHLIIYSKFLLLF